MSTKATSVFKDPGIREYRKGNRKGQSRETGNIGYIRQIKTKQKHNTICVGHHSTHTNTNHTEVRT